MAERLKSTRITPRRFESCRLRISNATSAIGGFLICDNACLTCSIFYIWYIIFFFTFLPRKQEYKALLLTWFQSKPEEIRTFFGSQTSMFALRTWVWEVTSIQREQICFLQTIPNPNWLVRILRGCDITLNCMDCRNCWESVIRLLCNSLFTKDSIIYSYWGKMLTNSGIAS